MKLEKLTYFAFAFTAAVAGFAGFVGGNMVAANGVDWMGWIGSLSGWAAATAAAATIFVLLRQIEENRVTTHKEQIEAKTLFDEHVNEILADINKCWRHTENALIEVTKTEDMHLLDMRAMNMKNYIEIVEHRTQELNLESFVSLMHPSDATSCRSILSDLKVIFRPQKIVKIDTDKINIVEIDVPDEAYLQIMRVVFSHFCINLESNAPSLAVIFSNREKGNVNEIVKRISDQLDKPFFGNFPDSPENPL